MFVLCGMFDGAGATAAAAGTLPITPSPMASAAAFHFKECKT
jgi:hypothetical protein